MTDLTMTNASVQSRLKSNDTSSSGGSSMTASQRQLAVREINRIIQEKVRVDWELSWENCGIFVMDDEVDDDYNDDDDVVMSEDDALEAMDDVRMEDGSSQGNGNDAEEATGAPREGRQPQPQEQSTLRWRRREVSPTCWRKLLPSGSWSSTSEEVDWMDPNELRTEDDRKARKQQGRRMRLKRRGQLETQMAINAGLRHWTAQRDAWSGGRLRVIRRRGHCYLPSDSSRFSGSLDVLDPKRLSRTPDFLRAAPPGEAPAPELGHSTETALSTAPPESTGTSSTPRSQRRPPPGPRPARDLTSDSEPVFPLEPWRPARRWSTALCGSPVRPLLQRRPWAAIFPSRAFAASPGTPSDGEPAPPLFHSSELKRVDVHEEVLVGKAIFPNTNPLRAQITPKTYGQIYAKCVIEGRTPAVPINLAHMVRAMVAGWKEDGTWTRAANDPRGRDTADRDPAGHDDASGFPTAQMQALELGNHNNNNNNNNNSNDDSNNHHHHHHDQPKTAETLQPTWQQTAEAVRASIRVGGHQRSVSIQSAFTDSPPPMARSATIEQPDRFPQSMRGADREIAPVAGQRRRRASTTSPSGEDDATSSIVSNHSNNSNNNTHQHQGAEDDKEGAEAGDSHGEGSSQQQQQQQQPTRRTQRVLGRGVGAVKKVLGGLRGRSRGYDLGAPRAGNSQGGRKKKMRRTLDQDSDSAAGSGGGVGGADDDDYDLDDDDVDGDDNNDDDGDEDMLDEDMPKDEAEAEADKENRDVTGMGPAIRKGKGQATGSNKGDVVGIGMGKEKGKIMVTRTGKGKGMGMRMERGLGIE